MRPEYRDGLLALVGLLALAGLTAVTGGIDTLLDPVGIVAGVVVALAIEAVFLQYPSKALDLWERRGVPVVSLCALVVAGALAVRVAPWLLSVPVWGLVTYLCLLGCVLLGMGNPLAVLLPESK